MTDPFLEDCGGWTPAPDVLARKYGFETAYAWGKIRRLCQLGKGTYTASHEAIAERIGMSRRTLIEILKVLIRDGYVEDLTPGVRNRAHTYSVKKGEEKIISGMQISHTDIETTPPDDELDTDMGMRIPHSDDAEIAQPDGVGMQILHTTYAENAYPGMQNLHLIRDSSLETPLRDKDSSSNEEGSNLQENQKSLLEPETEAEILLFEKINRNRNAKRLRPIKLFQALEQKESCNRQHDRLGRTKFERCIDYWLTQGITALGKLIIKLETWEIKKATTSRELAYPKKESLTFPQPPDPIPPPVLAEHVAIWETAKSQVRNQMTGATFDTLFKDAQPIERENGTFELRVKPSALEMIEHRPKVKANILAALQAVKPEIHSIDFEELQL